MTLCEQVGQLLPNLDAVNNPIECMEIDDQLEDLVAGIMALKHYAQLKAQACSSRSKGDIETAQFYENCCEASYERLPSWAKW